MLHLYCFYSAAPGLSRNVALKRTKIQLELLIDTDKLLMGEKRTGSGVYQPINRYTKANNKYMKNFEENKYFTYLKSFCEAV